MRISRRSKAKLILLLGFIRLVRLPNLLIIILTQYITRIFLIGPKEAWLSHILDPKLFLLSLSTVLVAAGGYIINDYYDIKIDTINKPKRIVVGRLLRRRKALAIHIVLNTLGLLLAFGLGLKIGAITLLSTFLLWLYSNQLKRLPFTGNFVIAALTAVSVIVVFVYAPGNNFLVYTFAFFAFSISLIREIIKDMEDVKGDATFGCQTLPIIWGIRRTKTLLYLLITSFLFVLVILSVYLDHSLITYFCIFILLPVGWLIFKLVRADTKKDFAYLSSLCKLIMLSGVLSMIWV